MVLRIVCVIGPRGAEMFCHLHYVHGLRAINHLIGATCEFMHKTKVQVKPDPPSVGGGAGTPDYKGWSIYIAISAWTHTQVVRVNSEWVEKMALHSVFMHV